MGLIVISPAVTIVTAITIILIVGILAVYLSILKKNGWIGETPNYRCPNPECQKIFQIPLKVKDFSNKKEVHHACPECGYDLGTASGKNGLKQTMLQSKPEAKISDSTSKRIETDAPMANNCKIESKAQVVALLIESAKDQAVVETDTEVCLKQKQDNPEIDRPACCNHYFGYLSGFQKKAETLDECYFCLRLIECSKKS